MLLCRHDRGEIPNLMFSDWTLFPTKQFISIFDKELYISTDSQITMVHQEARTCQIWPLLTLCRAKIPQVYWICVVNLFKDFQDTEAVKIFRCEPDFVSRTFISAVNLFDRLNTKIFRRHTREITKNTQKRREKRGYSFLSFSVWLIRDNDFMSSKEL